MEHLSVKPPVPSTATRRSALGWLQNSGAGTLSGWEGIKFYLSRGLLLEHEVFGTWAWEHLREWIAWKTYCAGWLEMNPEKVSWFMRRPREVGEPLPLRQGNRLAPLSDPLQTRYPDLSESPAGLLVMPGYLLPEWGFLAEAPFQTVGVFWPPSSHEELGTSLMKEALEDTAWRAALHWGGSVSSLIELDALPARGGSLSTPTPMRVYCAAIDDWMNTVMEWARGEHLRAIRVFEPPIGMWRDYLNQVEAPLRRSGIQLKRYRRCWDALHWPHADGTFEQFLAGFDQRIDGIVGSHP